MADDVRALIRELSAANPLWGAPRIHGELLKLGIPVSQSTVAKYIRRHRPSPSQVVADLPHESRGANHGRGLLRRADATFRLLLVLVVLAHDRRRIVHIADHPTAAWTAHQLRNALPDDLAPRCLLHDRDGAFAAVANTVAACLNLDAVRTAPRSPWQNAYAERVIGSIRRGCLDHVIVVSDASLRRVPAQCVATTGAIASRPRPGQP